MSWQRGHGADIDIARAEILNPIGDIAVAICILSTALRCYGDDKVEVSLDCLVSLARRPNGKLILATAISPTPAGKGETTPTIGLGDALNRIGR